MGDLALDIVRPRDSEALLDEAAFTREDLLPYWADLWPSAFVLARALRARTLRGARVLELGCGLGVPSIVAALSGGRVLATDWSRDALAFTADNARRNGAELDTARCDWGQPDQLLAGAPWDLVIASDVLYERRDSPLLLGLLPELVTRAGEVWIADPGRQTAERFLAIAAPTWRIRSRTERQRGAKVQLHRLRLRAGAGRAAEDFEDD